MHLKVILFTLTKYRITLAKKQDKKKIFIKIQISRKRDVTKKQVQGFSDCSTETIRIG